MQFPNSYFEDEVRDGFYVSSLMKRAWAAQLEILEDIDKVCKKYHLRYFAEWGTLLGAIRHGGFVPWDDDMDICMIREDYDAFLKVAPEEMSEWYSFLNFEHSDDGDNECSDFLTRLYNGNRIRVDKPFLDKFHGFPYVAGMDIFPIDYVAPTPKEDEMLLEQVKVLGSLAQTYNQTPKEEQEEYRKQIEEIYQVKFDDAKSIRAQIFMLADRLSGTYSEKESKYLTSMALRTSSDYKIPKEYYSDTIMMPFENTQIPVPIGYDGILKIKYGDYMKQVRDGGAHEYPFWKRQERVYEEKRPPLFPEYQFPKEEMVGGEKNMDAEAATLKSLAKNMIELFSQMHMEIAAMLQAKDPATALGLLEECQDGAIALGTKIEEVKRDSAKTVGALEQYCEALYVAHETIADNPETDETALQSMLDEKLAEVRERVEQNILRRKEAVFLPYKASMWDSLESVWEAADADPDCDAYVIPIPYYDKKADGQLGEMHYEGDQYPDYVPVLDYQSFDFAFHHPDMIFIHNPYDEYNLVTSVHPFFYSKNLKKLTDKLVYIPYFVLGEIKPTDGRAVESMKNFCTTPGVVHADVVVVQSEDMKQAYVNALASWAGEETRPVWEKKILGLGSPKYDRVLRNRENVRVPEEWKPILYQEDGTKKKVILYNTGLGSMLEHQEAMLDKMENVFALAKKRKDDFVLLWRPHPLLAATIKAMRPQLQKRYEKLVDAYCKEGFGIYDDTADLDRAICLSDAYYGDPSSVIPLCQKAGLPIMVQNVSVVQ